MNKYEYHVLLELDKWKLKMIKKPSLTNQLTRSIQHRVNDMIPEKIHQFLTASIKQMVRGVISGAKFTTSPKSPYADLETLENKVRERIKFYRSGAAIEGAVTGAGGFLSGLADFPLWLTLKMKMVFEIASYYGMELKDYKERIYILHIFQLAFSSQQHKNEIFRILEDWDTYKDTLSDDIHQFDWKTFQLEYRDSIDLAKMLQLIPGFGAVVGAWVNHQLTNKLGIYAMQAYRMRIHSIKQLSQRKSLISKAI